MSEIKISIDDQYLQAFVAFLDTLNYVQVEKITKGNKGEKSNSQSGNATETFLSELPPDSPMHQAVKPIRKSVTVEELIQESGYVKTDWDKVAQIGVAMDIQESTEELLAQLTP